MYFLGVLQVCSVKIERSSEYAFERKLPHAHGDADEGGNASILGTRLVSLIFIVKLSKPRLHKMWRYFIQQSIT